ncbi:MAG: hypothetical protein ACTSYL_04130 [Candidatus Thorarchaeota archaeon]
MEITPKIFFRAGLILLITIASIQLIVVGLQHDPSDQTLFVNIIFILLAVLEMPSINMVVLGYYTNKYNEEGSLQEPQSELGIGLVIIGFTGIIILILTWNLIIQLVMPKTLVNVIIGHYLFGIFYAGITVRGFKRGFRLRLDQISIE